MNDGKREIYIQKEIYQPKEHSLKCIQRKE